jgi:hypothetical protein
MHLNKGRQNGDNEARGHDFELLAKVGKVLKEDVDDSMFVFKISVVIKGKQSETSKFQLIDYK